MSEKHLEMAREYMEQFPNTVFIDGDVVELVLAHYGVWLDEQRTLQAHKEIDRLADFILKNMPKEIGKGNPRDGESAVDIAIRLLGEQREKDVCEYKWNAIEGRWECTCGYCLPHRVVFGTLCGNCGRRIKEVDSLSVTGTSGTGSSKKSVLVTPDN